jgi:SAM-dependent methyltransferase
VQTLAYTQLAELEDRHWWFRARRRVCFGLLRAHLQGRGPALPLRRVLDVGAGVGGMLDELSRIGTQVVYTDLSPELVGASRARGHTAGLLAHAEALPLADGAFDLVCLFDVLEHVEADEQALTDLHRVLAPGGTLFLHVPAHPLLYARNDRLSGHVRRYTRSGLHRRLTAAGFEIERLTYTNALLFPLIAPAVLGLRAVESLGLSQSEYTNLSWSSPPLASGLLEAAFASELALSRHFDLPIGHSLAAIGRRPDRLGTVSGGTVSGTIHHPRNGRRRRPLRG